MLRKKKALEAQLAETQYQLNSIHYNKENNENRGKKQSSVPNGKRNKQPIFSRAKEGPSPPLKAKASKKLRKDHAPVPPPT